MISAAEFLKWMQVFGLTSGGGGGGDLLAANNLSDVDSISASRTNLGLDTMAQQSASLVAITGGSADLDTLRYVYNYTEIAAGISLAAADTNEAFIMTAAGVDVEADLGLAGFPDGFMVVLKNQSAGNCTFTPKVGEFIDGEAQLTIPANQGVTIMKTSTEWSLVGQGDVGVDFATTEQVQQAAFNTAADTGAADVYVVTLAPVPAAYTDGLVVQFVPSATSLTTTPTLNANGLGAKTLVGAGGNALVAGDVAVNRLATAVYSATADNFELLNPQVVADVATRTEVQQAAFNTSADTGSADAYEAALTPEALSYTDGLLVQLVPSANNLTTTPTIKVDSLAIKTIVKAGGAVVAGDIVANRTAQLMYSATADNFELLNPQVESGGTVDESDIMLLMGA